MPISCSTYALFPTAPWATWDLSFFCAFDRLLLLCPMPSQFSASTPRICLHYELSSDIISYVDIFWMFSSSIRSNFRLFVHISILCTYMCVSVGVCVYFLTSGCAVFNVSITHSNVLFLKRITLQPCIVSEIKYVMNKWVWILICLCVEWGNKGMTDWLTDWLTEWIILYVGNCIYLFWVEWWWCNYTSLNTFMDLTRVIWWWFCLLCIFTPLSSIYCHGSLTLALYGAG